MSLSPIDIEVLRNELGSVVDEMYIALMRSAYSTNIKERRDHSTAIFDARGRVAVQGDSLPLHLASMLGLVEVVIDKFGRDGIEPGDMFISNDPFVGRGSHLPDIALLAPVFLDGELALFVSNIAHHADVGGMAAGSMAGGMTEIYQEGLRIPPIRIVRGGEVVDDVLDLILLNVRIPAERRGDYLAQIAANKLGVRRCEQLLRKRSIPRVAEGVDALIGATASRMRRAIADLPNGVFEFSDTIDDDGVASRDIPVRVRVTVAGDEVTFDFTGSSPQVRGNINNSLAGLQATVLYALKSLIDPEVAANHGMLDPVRIIAPEGSVVNAVFPAATAGRAQTCQRIIDAIYGALAQALPDRVIAASNGANTSVVFSGTDASGRYYLYMETIGGGAGARAYKDGTDGVQVHITNTSNLPIEALEREYPIVIERYEFAENSGGAGTWRGGLGLRRVYRALDHTTYFSGQAERFTSRPWGLFGAEGGAPGSFQIVDKTGQSRALRAKAATVPIDADSVLVVTTPGGGGYGPATARRTGCLDEDRRTGKVSQVEAVAEAPRSTPQSSITPQERSKMARTYDVVVVGGGISGASLAYYLQTAGAGKVLLIERNAPASGGTGKSAAIVRQHYSTPLMARLAKKSIGIFSEMETVLGRSGGFVRSGYHLLLPPQMLEAALANAAMQRTVGVQTETVDRGSWMQSLPWLDPEGVAGVLFEPDGGYADPVASTEAYVAAFERAGGTVRTKTPCRALIGDKSRVTGVVLDDGELAAGTVVNAAGPWAKPLAEGVGIAMQMRTVREQDTVWETRGDRPIPRGSVSNAVDAIYLRPLGDRRFIVGRGFPKDYVDVDPYNYKSAADDDFVADVQVRLERRFPSFAGARLIASYAALYDVTADWYPYVGPRADVAGYVDFCGGSGHGFKIAPAIAQELAKWMMSGKVADDFRPLSYDRLGAGKLFAGSYGGNRG